MNFKYSVIGDNSQENREWLEKVGYEEFHVSNCPCRFLYSTSEGYYLTSPILSTYAENNSIDCRSNPQLFQAVTAIRDDSDIHQLFVDELIELLRGKINMVVCEKDDKRYLETYTTFRKATLEELKEHFK